MCDFFFSTLISFRACVIYVVQHTNIKVSTILCTEKKSKKELNILAEKIANRMFWPNKRTRTLSAYLNSSMWFSKIRPNQPFRSHSCIKQKLFRCVVLIDGPSVMLTNEFEQTGTFILPNCGWAITIDYDSITTSSAI